MFWKKKKPSTLKIPYDKTSSVWISIYFNSHMKNYINTHMMIQKSADEKQYFISPQKYYTVFTKNVRNIKIEQPYKLAYLLSLRKFRNEFVKLD